MGKSKIFPILHENLTKIIWLIENNFVPLHQQLKQKENYMSRVYLRSQIVGDGTGNMSQEVLKENVAVHTLKHFYVIFSNN